MLTYLLVLLAAQSAWGACTLQVSAYGADELPRGVDTSNALITPWLVENTFDYLDGSDTNFLILSLVENLKDVAKVPDSRAQAIVMCQVITLVGELATGRSGDACDYAEYINSIVGNEDVALRTSYSNWISRINYVLDTFAALVSNKNEIRYQSGPVGNCVGGGRTYNSEALWDKLFNGVEPQHIELLNEQYCMAQRLRNAWSVRSNVAAAAVTSCVSTKSIGLFQKILAPLSNVLRTSANNGDVYGAVAQAKAQIAAVY